MAIGIQQVALGAVWVLASTSLTNAAAQDGNHQGKREAEICLACHTVDGSAGVGPSLAGVVGRTAGSVPSFRYSRAMRNAKIVWDEKTLDAYLADPQGVIPGNTMPFAGMVDGRKRSAVIEYLKSLK